MTELDAETLRGWVGKREMRADVIDARPVALLSATLDRADPPPQPGDVLPPLWHWLYFLPAYRQSEVGPDGHAKRGGFLPPVPLPRRMWAGSRIEWQGPLAIGDEVSRNSSIVSIVPKHGRSGDLVFVVVRHEISTAAGLALVEEHDIVYRGLGAPEGERAPAASGPQSVGPAAWTRRVVPDDVLLFRYSALTFNSHRIHYDQEYARREENYPDLVVHGPLTATLLQAFAASHGGKPLRAFEFRGMSPLFVTAGASHVGDPTDWSESERIEWVSVERLRPAIGEVLEAVEAVVLAQGEGEVVLEPRVHLEPGAHFRGHWNVLRAYVALLGVAGVKVVGDFVDNFRRDLPSELGLLTLYDPETGAPRAIMDATLLTSMRTGASCRFTAMGVAMPSGLQCACSSTRAGHSSRPPSSSSAGTSLT